MKEQRSHHSSLSLGNFLYAVGTTVERLDCSLLVSGAKLFKWDFFSLSFTKKEYALYAAVALADTQEIVFFGGKGVHYMEETEESWIEHEKDGPGLRHLPKKLNELTVICANSMQVK